MQQVAHLKTVATRSLLELVHGKTLPQGSSEQHRNSTTVHALNVLRLLFLDGSLASSLKGFVAETMMTAVKGFQSPKWAIRNSSTMVFSALVVR